MAKDYVTGKTTQFGRSHTHHRGVAGGRWKKRAQKTLRTFKPNLQTVTIIEDGSKKKVKLAAKTLKRVKKDMLEGRKPAVRLAFVPSDLQQAIADKQTAAKKVAEETSVVQKPAEKKAKKPAKAKKTSKASTAKKAAK